MVKIQGKTIQGRNDFLLLVRKQNLYPKPGHMNRSVRLFFLLTLLMALSGGPLFAQFNLSGEFRPRVEYRDGYSKLHDSSKTGVTDILGRNRLVADFSDDHFSARFSLQHAYVYGENNYASDTITKNTINIYEAWFRYNFTKRLGIQIGRQELVYDDQRLFGNSNWNAKGATHDLVMFRWNYPDLSYVRDLGFAVNNAAPMSATLASYNLVKNYKYMAFLYEQKKFLKDQLTASVLVITDIFQKPAVTTSTTRTDTVEVYDNLGNVIGYTLVPVTTTKSTSDPEMLYGRITFGGTATYTWKKLKVSGSGFYQTGHFSDGRKINAGFYGGWVSYKILKPVTLLVGYERLSGNDFSDTANIGSKLTGFSTLYGTGHSLYGYMDMFNSQVTSGTSPGLTDLYARATVAFSTKASLEATWRMFGLAKEYLEVKNPAAGKLPFTKVDKNLGHEIDLMFVYKPVKNFEVNAAYCFFLPTESMETLNGLKTGTAEWAQYAYVMLTYKPTFFNSDKK